MLSSFSHLETLKILETLCGKELAKQADYVYVSLHISQLSVNQINLLRNNPIIQEFIIKICIVRLNEKKKWFFTECIENLLKISAAETIRSLQTWSMDYKLFLNLELMLYPSPNHSMLYLIYADTALFKKFLPILKPLHIMMPENFYKINLIQYLFLKAYFVLKDASISIRLYSFSLTDKETSINDKFESKKKSIDNEINLFNIYFNNFCLAINQITVEQYNNIDWINIITRLWHLAKRAPEPNDQPEIEKQILSDPFTFLKTSPSKWQYALKVVLYKHLDSEQNTRGRAELIQPIVEKFKILCRALYLGPNLKVEFSKRKIELGLILLCIRKHKTIPVVSAKKPLESVSSEPTDYNKKISLTGTTETAKETRQSCCFFGVPKEIVNLIIEDSLTSSALLSLPEKISPPKEDTKRCCIF